MIQFVSMPRDAKIKYSFLPSPLPSQKKFSAASYGSEIDVINKTRVMTEEIEYLSYSRIYQPFQSTKVDALTSK